MARARKVVISYRNVSTKVDGYELVGKQPDAVHIHLQLESWERAEWHRCVQGAARGGGLPFGAIQVKDDICTHKDHHVIVSYQIKGLSLRDLVQTMVHHIELSLHASREYGTSRPATK
jgi:hypothetical protein